MNFYIFLAVLAGAVLAVQIGVNHSLRAGIGNPIVATLASFVVGAICLFAYVLLARLPWPSLTMVSKVPLWSWSGGALGAFYVAATVVLAPKLGAANLISMIVAAQMFTSLVLDHFGLIGFAQHSMNFARLFGALLLVAGVVLIVRN